MLTVQKSYTVFEVVHLLSYLLNDLSFRYCGQIKMSPVRCHVGPGTHEDSRRDPPMILSDEVDDAVRESFPRSNRTKPTDIFEEITLSVHIYSLLPCLPKTVILFFRGGGGGYSYQF